MPKVQSGLDVFLAHPPKALRKARLGVLCHQASVTQNLIHILEAFRQKGLTVSAIFGPEHGLWGTAQDQVEVADHRDNTLDVPVYSLYGDTRVPKPEWLEGIDVLICDLQDVGSRYYTFIWTMALAMQACARAKKKFIVLDRPNPLDGVTLEGPLLDLNFASFVGLYALPVRHGMTIGEIALWIDHTYRIGANPEIIPMKHWRRKMHFEATGLPWVPPSPNMPTVDTAYVYPGLCLIEGTQLSEGRGTTRPFEWIGAPYINPEALTTLLNRDRLPGVVFRPCWFEPVFHKYSGEMCGGLQTHVTDRSRFRPFLTGVTIIKRIYDLYPRLFAWRPPPYEYEREKLPFDILCGNTSVREAIENGNPLTKLQSSWEQDVASFRQGRKPFLLYN